MLDDTDLTNIHSDPQHSRTDAELISVLQRAWLLPRDGVKDPAAEAKFSLDSTVSDEGLLIDLWVKPKLTSFFRRKLQCRRKAITSSMPCFGKEQPHHHLGGRLSLFLPFIIN